MKYLGLFFIILGIGFLIYAFYQYVFNSDTIVSPIPEEKGVKVIFVTPTK